MRCENTALPLFVLFPKYMIELGILSNFKNSMKIVKEEESSGRRGILVPYQNVSQSTVSLRNHTD